MNTVKRVVVLAVMALPGFCAHPAAPVAAVAAEREEVQPSAPGPRKTAGWLGDGSGCYPDAAPATEWSPEKNMLWSVQVGPNNFSSAIVADGKIFLVAEPSWMVCVDAGTGKILWKMTNEFSDLPKRVEETPAQGDTANTTPTPVSDGQFVYASFGSGIVACYDLQGHRRWITHISGEAPGYGRSASPVLADGKLLVSIGNLIALDAKTGRKVWKAEAVQETYGTPAKATIGGVGVVIAPSGEIVRVSDGAILASIDARLLYASPIVHDDVVYFMDASSTALKLPDNAAGELRVKKLWEASLEGEFFASPVYINGLLFTANDQGKLYIVDAKDGKILASEDLPFEAGGGHIYSSLAAAGKHVFVNNVTGETLAIEAAREYKKAKLNRLSEGSGGTPVFEGKRMFLRGGETLYGIGGK